MTLNELREKVLIKTQGIGEEWDLFVINTYIFYGVLPAYALHDDFELDIEFLKLF